MSRPRLGTAALTVSLVVTTRVGQAAAAAVTPKSTTAGTTGAARATAGRAIFLVTGQRAPAALRGSTRS
jgi:hypothetical protein